MSGSSLTGGGKTRKSRTGGAARNTYMLQSVDSPRFRTVVEAGAPGVRRDKDGGSVDSRERIVDESANGAEPRPGWPRMDTTISVHSSKRQSADETAETRAGSFLIE